MRSIALRDELRRQAARLAGIRGHAARLALGEITLAQFFDATRLDWERLAVKLFRCYRGKLPEGVEASDLAQEMRLECVRVLPKWDPAQRPIGDYLVFNTYAKAKKEVNKQRNSEGRDGSAPSRVPTPASRLAKRTKDGDLGRTPLDRASIGADQEPRLEGAEAYRRVRRSLLGQDGTDGSGSEGLAVAVSLRRLVTGAATAKDERRVRLAIEKRPKVFEPLIGAGGSQGRRAG